MAEDDAAMSDRGLELFFRQMDRTSRAQLELQILQMSIIAEESATCMGQPVLIKVEWPDGPPHGFTEDSIREWARESMERLKATRKQL